MARSTDRTKPKTTGSSSLALKRGRRLGKYRLAKYLGEGGSCEVWKARDSVEGIWVALKIPLADAHGKRDNQALLREVRLVAQLRHPHIMPVKNADIIGEHAVLEDCGEDSGVAALRATGYEPVAGAKPGEPGHLARRVVLGRPALLPEGGRTE